jgi:ribosomal silencing factor RsfS
MCRSQKKQLASLSGWLSLKREKQRSREAEKRTSREVNKQRSKEAGKSSVAGKQKPKRKKTNQKKNLHWIILDLGDVPHHIINVRPRRYLQNPFLQNRVIFSTQIAI